jgi:hypothetical protein
MTLRGVPADYACDLERDDLPTEEGNDPVKRPPELELSLPPPHLLLEGDTADDVRQETREDLPGILALLNLLNTNEFGVFLLPDLQFRYVDTL